MGSEISTGSGPGYFIVHHKKNGRGYGGGGLFGMLKTAYNRMNHRNRSKRKNGVGFKESHPNY